MSNREFKTAKKKAEINPGESEITGRYAKMDELVEAKEAELKKVVPELDLAVLLQRIRE